MSEQHLRRAQIRRQLICTLELNRVHAQDTRDLDVHRPVVDEQAFVGRALHYLHRSAVVLWLWLKEPQIARAKKRREQIAKLKALNAVLVQLARLVVDCGEQAASAVA